MILGERFLAGWIGLMGQNEMSRYLFGGGLEFGYGTGGIGGDPSCRLFLKLTRKRRRVKQRLMYIITVGLDRNSYEVFMLDC
jgi:hypothetical protein